jgi:alpha-ribazole phosphatase
MPEGICYGSVDVDLADSADVDLVTVKEKLMHHEPVIVFSSPLKRCRKLAEFLFPDKVDNSIIFDDRLMEMNFGDWSLKTWDEIGATKAGKKWFSDHENKPVPGGESFIDLFNRVLGFWEEVKTKSYDSVVVVAHVGVIKAFLCILENKSSVDVFGSNNIGNGEIITKEVL